MRAIGEYVTERGVGKAEGAALVKGFFGELEGLDVALLQAERSSDDAEIADAKDRARKKLDGTIAALDKLVENVPADAMNKARAVFKASAGSLEGEIEGDGGEGGGAMGGDNFDEAELKRLQKLL